MRIELVGAMCLHGDVLARVLGHCAFQPRKPLDEAIALCLFFPSDTTRSCASETHRSCDRLCEHDAQ